MSVLPIGSAHHKEGRGGGGGGGGEGDGPSDLNIIEIPHFSDFF